MLFLAIDASTYDGSVALVEGAVVVAEASVAMRGQHEERLMPAVVALLETHGVTAASLDAVACGAGPGSFTSLRIAASIAKGVADARGIPLLAAPSPLLVVAAASLPDGAYIAALDAMRGDWFCQRVDVERGTLRPGAAWRSSRQALDDDAAAAGAFIVGPAEAEARIPHARGFARLVEQRLVAEVDLVSWEPDYGRKAEAQVKWEAAHGRELGSSGS